MRWVRFFVETDPLKLPSAVVYFHGVRVTKDPYGQYRFDRTFGSLNNGGTFVDNDRSAIQ
jgi:hypothetical protein